MGPTVAVISSTYGNRMFVPMLSTTATPMVTRNSTGSSHESDMTSKMITASVSARTTTQARFSRLSYKTRYAMPAVFAALFIASFILQGYTQIVFTEENDDPLANVFPKKNTVAVVYRNEDEAKIDSVISELEKDERVSDILGYANTLGKEMTAEDMGKAVAELSDDAEPIGDNLLRMLYFIAEDGKMPVITASDFINFITDTVLPDKTIGKHLDAATIEP